MQRDVVVEYVADKPREFGESGAAVKVMVAGGDELEYSSNREYAPKHIEALKKLIGAGEVTVDVEETQYGIKLKEYPGKPTGGGGKGQQRQGDWQSHAEREFTSASITAQVAAKILAETSDDPKLIVATIQEYAAPLAIAIQEAAASLLAHGGYPAKAAAPPPPPSSNGEDPVSGSTAVAERLRSIIEVGEGDAKAVIRAKAMLRDKLGNDDFSLLTEDEFAQFLAEFALNDPGKAL